MNILKTFAKNISFGLYIIWLTWFLELTKHPRYLGYVLQHKWLVYVEGRKLGLGRWLLIKHDLSKFRPDEWFPYVEYLYGSGGHRHMDFGWTKEAFLRAIQRHYRRNNHHWQHYENVYESHTYTAAMPLLAFLEMIADWRAVSIQKNTDVAEWYLHQRAKNKIRLAPPTRWLVERILNVEAADPEPDTETIAAYKLYEDPVEDKARDTRLGELLAQYVANKKAAEDAKNA